MTDLMLVFGVAITALSFLAVLEHIYMTGREDRG